MKNAFSRFGQTCVSLLIGGGLAACALAAANTSVVTVNLPYTVTVGSSTLPSGQYTISSMNTSAGEDLFLIRAENGTAITIQAQKIQPQTRAEKTEVTLSKDGETWSMDKLFVNGEGFQFLK
ncbi:MAG TPA: hypothetical protein VNH18_15635 [Bryobacteraceae bacterium]|nr:hypothetical protein [Bryobacteraceae bacterium]